MDVERAESRVFQNDRETPGRLSMLEIESAGLTDVGKRRKGNEDALIVDDLLGLYVVADGMGGHNAGEIASQMVVNTIRHCIAEYKNGTVPPSTGSDDASLSDPANRILDVVRQANRTVYAAAAGNEDYQGMGSTVSLLYFHDQTIVVANVGDSPIFLVHNGQIETISEIHTLLEEQRAVNPRSAAALDEKYGHVLTRAIGVRESVEVTVCEFPFFRDNVFVIGSDGLTDLVAAEEIQAVVESCPAEDACRRLVELANERGGVDNISVIVLKIIKAAGSDGKVKRFITRVTGGLPQFKSKKEPSA